MAKQQTYASAVGIVPEGGQMSEAKRGRLRSVSVRPMYDEKGKVSGHTVSADHEAEGKGYGYVSPIESPHESMQSAEAKVHEHLLKNHEANGKKARPSMRDAIRSA